MNEYIFEISEALYNKETGEAVMKPIYKGDIVRCKDCKYCTQFKVYKDLWYICVKHEINIDVNADDFCSKAERGNDETN